MTAQEYLQSLLNSQDLSETELSGLRKLRENIEQQLRTGLQKVERVYYAGSFGKKTMIQEQYDLDIVVYWASNCGFTLEAIYNGVGKMLAKHWKFVNPKTVAWELPFEGGFHIDVVPGRAIEASFKYANLYRRDTKSSLQTSIKVHLDTVRNSGRRDSLRFAMRHPMHDPVSHGFDRTEHRLRFEPIEEESDRRIRLRGVDRGTILRLFGGIFEGQFRAAQTDAVHFPLQEPSQRFASLIYGEPDARGAAVDREDGWSRHGVFPVFWGSSLFKLSIRALIATITVLADISTAPSAGVSNTPHV